MLVVIDHDKTGCFRTLWCFRTNKEAKFVSDSETVFCGLVNIGGRGNHIRGAKRLSRTQISSHATHTEISLEVKTKEGPRRCITCNKRVGLNVGLMRVTSRFRQT